MIKILLGILFLTSTAHAQPESVETFISTFTISAISVASHTQTSVMQTTGPSYRSISIQNLNATHNVFCSEKVNMTTHTVANLPYTGWRIVPGETVTFPVVPGKDFYCQNGSDSTATLVNTLRGR